jgi:hypothetical protein
MLRQQARLVTQAAEARDDNVEAPGARIASFNMVLEAEPEYPVHRDRKLEHLLLVA